MSEDTRPLIDRLLAFSATLANEEEDTVNEAASRISKLEKQNADLEKQLEAAREDACACTHDGNKVTVPCGMHDDWAKEQNAALLAELAARKAMEAAMKLDEQQDSGFLAVGKKLTKLEAELQSAKAQIQEASGFCAAYKLEVEKSLEFEAKLREAKARVAFMCQDGHAQIFHNSHEFADKESCPLCEAQNKIARLREALPTIQRDEDGGTVWLCVPHAQINLTALSPSTSKYFLKWAEKAEAALKPSASQGSGE